MHADLRDALARIATFDTAALAPEHKPIESQCARFYRTVHNATKGPRGGHRVTTHVECTGCGKASPAIESKGRECSSQEHHAMLRVLRVNECSKPVRASTSAILLVEVRSLIESGDKMPLRFAVEHRLGGGRTIAAAIAEAWDGCDDGVPMGKLVGAIRKRAIPNSWEQTRYREDGRMVQVDVYLHDIRVELTGTRESTAHALQRLVEGEQIGKRAAALL